MADDPAARAEGASTPSRFARAGVRLRTTSAAVVVVAVVLVAAAVVFVVALRGALDDRARDAARVRARAVAVSVRDTGAGVDLPEADEVVMQVVDRSGRVVAASRGLVGDQPLADLEPGGSARVDDVTVRDDDETEREAYLVVARPVGVDGQRVLAGESLESADESVATAVRLFVIGIPVVLVLLGLVMWRVVGRALAPVERARAEVENVSERDLHRRVQEVPTDDEIGRLTRTLNGLLARLEAAQARQRRFVSDSSHELRSPVATIRHHAEVARDHPDATTVRELAGDVLAEELRLEQLVDDLLWVARLDEASARSEPRVVDLDDIVLDEARRAAATTTARIEVAAVSAGRVAGDPRELRRLVRNLLDNGARHAHARVSVALEEIDATVHLAVDDDGPGIALADRERVFDRFVRLDDARARDDGGSGLGLAIVAEIVRRHDGTVAVTDAPVGGARFEVVLPRG